MMTVAISESPLVGGGVRLPLRPLTKGDFAFPRIAINPAVNLHVHSRIAVTPGKPYFSPQARTVSFVSTSGCDPTVLPPGGVFSSDGRGNPWNGCFREYRIGSRLWKSSPSLVKPDTCGQWARKNLASNTTRIMGDNARPTLQGPFTKTERSSCRHVLVVDCQEVASKGLESPEYKPLMRKPRGGSIPAKADRLYCQHDFPRRFNKNDITMNARRHPDGMRLSSPSETECILRESLDLVDLACQQLGLKVVSADNGHPLNSTRYGLLGNHMGNKVLVQFKPNGKIK